MPRAQHDDDDNEQPQAAGNLSDVSEDTPGVGVHPVNEHADPVEETHQGSDHRCGDQVAVMARRRPKQKREKATEGQHAGRAENDPVRHF